MCRTDKYGFPSRHVPRQKRWFGFTTGDLVTAVVPRGTYQGTHVGRVAVRSRPSFRLNGIDIHPKHMHRIQAADGYAYATRTPAETAPRGVVDAGTPAVLPFLRTPEGGGSLGGF